MTVRELIEALSKCNPDFEVKAEDEMGDACEKVEFERERKDVGAVVLYVSRSGWYDIE